MAAAAPLGCDFVPSLRCAMDSAWVYFGLFSGNFDGIRFLHGWFANFTPDCAHFGWDMDFLLHAGLCPLLLGHGFSADFLLYGDFGDLSLFRNFVLRWRPRQHFSDFTARLCQHPRLRRKLK